MLPKLEGEETLKEKAKRTIWNPSSRWVGRDVTRESERMEKLSTHRGLSCSRSDRKTMVIDFGWQELERPWTCDLTSSTRCFNCMAAEGTLAVFQIPVGDGS